MKFRSKIVNVCCLLAATTSLQAAGPELGYSITFDGIDPSWGGFRVTIENNSRDFEITHFEMTIGDDSLTTRSLVLMKTIPVLLPVSASF
jgi:hypothetical protein